MRQIYRSKIGVLLALCCSAIVFLASCNNDEKSDFVAGDTSRLKLQIDSCNAMMDTIATSENYDTKDKKAFTDKFGLIKELTAAGNLSQDEVNNMQIHLRKAQLALLGGRMEKPPYANLIAAWNFDTEGTSQVSDGLNPLTAFLKTGPNEIFGTDTDVPQFAESGIGKSLHFAKGAHLEVANYNPSDFLGKQLTIALWVKPEVMKGGNYIASLNYWNNWKFQIQEQGKAFFTVHTNAGYTDADNEYDLSLMPGKWKHVVVVLDLDTRLLSFYIDGALTKQWTSSGKPNLTGSQSAAYASPLGKRLPLMIAAATTYEEAKVSWTWDGWATPTSWDHFEGWMDEVKFYNVALTSGQVRWMYNQEAALVKE